MSEPFPTRPDPRDLRGGVLHVSPHDDEDACTIAAHFPVEAKVAEMLGEPFADLRYVVRGLDSPKRMEQVRKGLLHLHETEDHAFQRKERAFGDEHGLRMSLRDLARCGKDLHKKLFGFGQADSYENDDYDRSDWPVWGQRLRDWLLSTDGLHIVCPCHYVPWNILYDGDPEVAQIDVSRFWGFGKRVELFPPGVSPFPRLPQRWQAALGIDNQDETIREGSELHDHDAHPFRVLHDRMVRVTAPNELFLALPANHILYHYGHGHGSARGFEYSSITLNGSPPFESTTLESLLQDLPALTTTEPRLVYLNGCSTAVGDRAEGTTFVDVLVKGRRGCFCFVTTLGAVPPWGAAEFARLFFEKFLGTDGAGETLGDSLAYARKEMLKRWNSPIGLLYAAHGKLSTRL